MLIFFQTGAVSDGEPDIERLMDRYSQPLMLLLIPEGRTSGAGGGAGHLVPGVLQIWEFFRKEQ